MDRRTFTQLAALYLAEAVLSAGASRITGSHQLSETKENERSNAHRTDSTEVLLSRSGRGIQDAHYDLVATVRDLRDVTPRAGVPNHLVLVLGYAVPNDGGGGLFRWNGNPDRESDGGIRIESGREDMGVWHRFHGGDKFNVRWWGARGDGETDDAAAVQKALDSAIEHTADRRADRTSNTRPGSGAPTVFLPPGSYRIGKGLRIDPPQRPSFTRSEDRYFLPVRLAGAGGGTVIRLVSGVADNCLTIDGARTSPGYMLGPMVENLVLDGGYDSSAPPRDRGNELQQNGLYIRRVQHAIVRGVRVQNTVRDGIRSIGCFYNKYSYSARQIRRNALHAYQNAGIELDLQARIEPRNFVNEGAGISLSGCTDFVIRPGTILEHFRTSIRLLHCKNCYLTNAIASYSHGDNVVVDGQSSSIFFDQCTLVAAGQAGREDGAAGIRMQGTPEKSPSWIVVRNCLFTNWDLPTPTQTVGVSWEAGGATGFRLEGCTFSGDHEETFRFKDVSREGYDRIANNVRLDGEPVQTTARGTAQIFPEQTVATVDSGIHAHVAVRPEHIQITPTSRMGQASHWWVEASDDGQFVIRLDAAPGQEVTFNWFVDARTAS